MNQPFKPPSPPKGKPLRGPDAPDDLSIPVLTERVNVPPRATKAVPPLDFDIELPPIAAATPATAATDVAGAVPVAAASAPAPEPASAPAPEPTTVPAPGGGSTGAPTVGQSGGSAGGSGGGFAAGSARGSVGGFAGGSAGRSSGGATTSASTGATRPRYGSSTAGSGADRIDPPAPGAPWGRIEIELREAILNDLAQRLPQEVEAIVRRHMTNAIDTLVERLAGDTRIAVAASLREIVGHAVRAELERLRLEKRQS
jgi:hypothetical protein